MIWNIFGTLLIILAVLGIVPAFVSGAGLPIVLCILMLSGITALSGNIKYALVVLAITTVNLTLISIFSPLPTSGDQDPEGKFIGLLVFTIPYIVTILLILIGRKIKIKRDKAQSAK